MSRTFEFIYPKYENAKGSTAENASSGVGRDKYLNSSLDESEGALRSVEGKGGENKKCEDEGDEQQRQRRTHFGIAFVLPIFAAHTSRRCLVDKWLS